MERKDVYRLIDREREYQLSRHEIVIAEHPHKDEDHHPADWVIYMEEHLEAAKIHIYNFDTKRAMEEIRKIAALAVAAMEHIETPGREEVEDA